MNIIFLIPKLDNTGPVKGTIALAELLSNYYKIKIIFFKENNVPKLIKSKNIAIDSLENNKTLLQKIISLRFLIKKIKSKNKEKVILITQAFSADLISLFTIDLIPRIVSVRGNLVLNYFFTYKFWGFLLAILHLNLMRFSSRIIVMHNLMQKQVSFYTNRTPTVIANFINEKELSEYFIPNIDKTKPLKFVFVGSLQKRKNPMLLLKSFSKISNNIDASLHFLGDGPLFNKLQKYIELNNLENKVILHGFQDNPYKIMSNSDLLVLPSFSEGTSRAALESLFLGVPCILKNVDSNNELLRPEFDNGSIFNKDIDLPDIMLYECLKSRRRDKRKNLLPVNYRQTSVKNKYRQLIDEI